MKANLKNILGLVAGMTLLATTVPTWAGRVSTSSVIIHDNGVWSTATGNLVDADNRQQIGCTAHTLSSYSWTTCFATNSAGRTLVCGSGDWKFLEPLRAMTDSSYIYFTTGSTGNVGECKDISIDNSSYLLK